MKKVFLETYGCQMNVYDSELIKSILQKNDYSFTTEENDADIVMLNTCSVRENANRKVYERINEIKSRRPKKNEVLIGVLGCMATNFRKALLDNSKLKIDFIAGPDSYKHLPDLISQVTDAGQKSFDVTLSEFETYSDVYPSREAGVNAWIAIMRGCNNFCTFCVVPYTRGRERSRDPHNVLDEVKRLVSDGFPQITLLGQNVNSYRYEDTDFTDLIKMVSDVEGVKRIRYTSPHPKDFPTKLLRVMAERPNICNQIHLPLQAGNDRVLDKMNRTYTKAEFLDVVTEIRTILPNCALSTDVIVGFPTETDEEFEDTYDVMQQVGFDTTFMFKYSERQGTLASKKFSDDVPEAIKTERIMRLITLQKETCLKKNEAHVGSIQTVLIEGESSKKDSTDIVSRNEGNTLVLIPAGPYKQGDFIDVKITGATPHILRGQPV